eukprot:Mrub_04590.p1 GENE.Mrub_04590~~Mrub_04590.p1  ORF type:complete len:400 (+),score=145.84 Mrub_04590:3-1202(+)
MNNLIVILIFILIESIIHNSGILQFSNPQNSIGNTNNLLAPPPVANTTLHDYMQSSIHQYPLATSFANSCVITDRRKTLHCWGDNMYGQLDITKEFRHWIHKVALGVRHVCVIRLKEKGNTQYSLTYCWGTNTYGQLNIDYNSMSVDIQAGRAHTCVQKIDIDEGEENSNVSYDKNTLKKYVMNDDFYNKYYNDRIDCYGSFVSIKDSNEDNFDKIEELNFNKNNFIINFESGYSHMCAIGYRSLANNVAIENLTDELHLSCVGSNYFGELDVPPLHAAIVVYSLGDSNTCALVHDGAIACWGSNRNLQNVVHARRMLARPFYVAVMSGAAHTCAQTSANYYHFWGNNDWDQARDMYLDRTKQYAMSLGGFHNCLYDGSSELKCWGSNSLNQCSVPKEL